MSKHLKIHENTSYIISLINQGEHQNLDFKQEIDDARKVARAMAAFANTNGGILLIGVKDNGIISGIRTEEEWYMLQAAAEYYTKPKISYTINLWRANKKNVIEAIIHESKQKPHYVQNEKGKWSVYLRVKDQNIVADPIVVHIIKMQYKYQTRKIIIREEEQKVLTLLNDLKETTFNEILRLSVLPYHIVKNIVTKLVLIKVLQYKPTTKETIFYIENMYKLNELISKKRY
jgi:predicted HTH transcriptional regulator